MGLLVEIGAAVNPGYAARARTLAGLGEAREGIDARGHGLGERLIVGDRHLALHGFHQELLVAADAQAFDGRDRQRNTDRFETVTRRSHRCQLDVDRRQQRLDTPVPRRPDGAPGPARVCRRAG